MADWKPGASFEVIKLRAELLARVRRFFACRDVLEVETPLLARATVTDVHLTSFQVACHIASGPGTRYLQTSPEFAMKRLLCAGVGPIYQICKAFRDGDESRRHNPEFTLLEWYRPGFSLAQLMDEVEELLGELLGCRDLPRYSYRELFRQYLDVDPHELRGSRLAAFVSDRLDLVAPALSDTDFLQLLMSHIIEPQLPDYCFVYNYPRAQAALAALGTDEQGQEVAQRFELYGGGMELANGYFELTDAEEQRRRFDADLADREKRKLPRVPVDENLLAAMAAGLPGCAGVALGFDRLLMLAAGVDDIGQVLTFDNGRS